MIPLALSPRIASIRIMACRDTLAAGLATRYGGLYPSDAAQAPDDSGQRITVNDAALRGVTLRALEALPSIVAPMRCESMDDLHDAAVAKAWRAGAWDIKMSMVPALDGADLGLVLANMDYGLAQDLPETLVDAARRGRLATWLWLPMQEGPAGRQGAHASKDRTLGPDGGRSGDPPEGLRRPVWEWRKSRDWVIRLGDWADEHRPMGRLATAKQRGYLGRLLRDAGLNDLLPARLSSAEASAWITRLKDGA